MDCGAACLGMICRHFGRRVSLSHIRTLANTGAEGTSLKSIVRTASDLGLAARSVKASLRNLEYIPLPAIVHWDGNHWICLFRLTSEYAFVADPAVGIRRFSREEFVERWSGYAALFDYTAEFENAPESKSRLGWILAFFVPYRDLLIKAGLLSLVVSALQMVLPVFTQVIVDRVLVESSVGLLNMIMLSMLVVLTFITAAVLLQRYMLSFIAVRVDASTLDFLARRLLSLPMSYFNQRRTGDIQRRIEGVSHIREFVVHNCISGVTALIQLSVALLVMVLYSPTLSLVFLATTPLYIG